MRRKEMIAKTVTQSNDAGCITSSRGKARRAKRQSSKKLRAALKKEDKNADIVVPEIDPSDPAV